MVSTPSSAAFRTTACLPPEAGRQGSEFNGAGPFLTALNAPRRRRREVTAGIAWMTIRSDNNDKFAQPDGVWIGARGTPTNVTLRRPGAERRGERRHRRNRSSRDLVQREGVRRDLPLHHRSAPATLAIVAGARVVLDGTVSGLGLDNRQGNFATNLPLVGATARGLRRPTRRPANASGAAVHARRSAPMAAGGRSRATAGGALRVRHRAPGYATTHVYRRRSRARRPSSACAPSGSPTPTATRRARHADPAARLLRRAARPHRSRRREPAGGRPARRRRRVDGAPQDRRRRRRGRSSASSTTSASSAAPGRSPTTTSSSSS